MNNYQRCWWEQARSDYVALIAIRRQGAAPCHHLHYLQMVTEKLSKAYFWRSGLHPKKATPVSGCSCGFYSRYRNRDVNVLPTFSGSDDLKIFKTGPGRRCR